MSESEWTDRLNVNRSALREAFVRLEAEGLIEAGPKSGYIVPALALEDLHELLAVRLGLEGVAIDIICQSGFNTPQQLQPMHDACDLLERLVTEEYRLSVVESDRRFHELLIQTSRNKRLAIAYTHAPFPIIHPDVINAQQWVERVRRILKEHRDLLKAVQTGKPDQARKLLNIHLKTDLENIDIKTKAGRPIRLRMRTVR